MEKSIYKQCAQATLQIVADLFERSGYVIANSAEFHEAVSNYSTRYIDRYGAIKILGMDRPVSLFEVYTEVCTVTTSYLREMQDLDYIEKNFKEQGKRGFGTNRFNERSSGIQQANDNRFLNVLGQPGAGKSTFLKYLGFEAMLPRKSWSSEVKKKIADTLEINESHIVWSKFELDCIPVLIELKRFRHDPIDVYEAIVREFELAHFPNPSDFVIRALGDGKLLILLDGLDEVPTDKLDLTITHITDFVDKFGLSEDDRKRRNTDTLVKNKSQPKPRTGEVKCFSPNRFVTSCRTAFYKSSFKRFTDVVLADFDDEQIKVFIKRWFHESNKTFIVEDLLEKLNSEANKAILELGRTPLLLTFICLIFDAAGRIPANRSALYKRALDILIERWAAEKRVHQDPVYKDLHAEFELQMLADIAGIAFDREQLFFTKKELTNAIAIFLKEELQAPKNLNSAQVLYAIEMQQGILVERADGIYSFSHLTIQEYLTAVYYLESGNIDVLVRNSFLDTRWREVFLLLSGMLSKSDDLIRLMADVLRSKNFEQNRFRDLMTWLKDKISYERGQIGLERRAGALLHIVSLSLPRASERNDRHIRALTEINTALHQLLDELSVKNRREYIPKTKLAISTQMDLNFSSWTKSEYEELVICMRATLLIVECSNASVRLSKSTWEIITSELLTIT